MVNLTKVETLPRYTNFMHFYIGIAKERRPKNSVSIVVKKSLQQYYRFWEAVDDKLMVLETDLFGHHTLITAAYASTDYTLITQRRF